jgi:lysine biosynthesis protein LysW
MLTAYCPNCHSDIIIDDSLGQGDLVTCANCGAQSEISSMHPLRLTLLDDEIEENNETDDEELEN